MKNIYFKIAVLTILFTAVFNLTYADEIQKGKIVVKFKEGFVPQHSPDNLSGNADLDALLISEGLKSKKQLFSHLKKQDNRGLSRVFEFNLDDETDVQTLANLISKIDAVEYAEPRIIRTFEGSGSSANPGYRIDALPNDPFYSLQWYLPSISAPPAWDYSKGDPSVIIAIVDNGVERAHPDLASRMWVNSDETPGNGVDDDGNGFIDDFYGWDFALADNDPKPDYDSTGMTHGTHVSGIAAASMDNGKGIAGVAPLCKIMAVKAGSGNAITNGAEGITYAYENGAKVINLSWGGYFSSSLEEDAIINAINLGILVVAAAGNDNSNEPHYPSSYAQVLSVASINSDSKKTSWSNYGETIDLCAPGNIIYSTIVLESGVSSYAYLSGTSMASPVVAGVAGLVFAANPTWHQGKVAVKILNSGDYIYDVNPQYAGELGFGKVNAYKAVADLTPGFRLNTFYFSDVTTGDGDGIAEPYELLEVYARLENILQSAYDVQATLTCLSTDGVVTQTNAYYGDILAGQFAENTDEPFLLQLGNVQENEKIYLELHLETQSGFDFSIRTSITTMPPWASHYAGNVKTTVTSFGAIGYQNYPYNPSMFEQIGEGFRYPAASANALYHGGMILALNNSRIASTIYRDYNPPYDFEWIYDNLITFEAPGPLADQQTHAVYYDNGVFVTGVNAISVEQNTYARSDDPVDDFIIIEFTYTNNSASTLNNMYSGIFMDWDINNYTDNSVGYSATHKTSYMFDDDSIFYGLSALTDEVAGNPAISNSYYLYGAPLSDANLYNFMSGGYPISNDSGEDFSHILSVGPFTLSPDSSKTVAFAILGGTGYDDYIANVDAADSLYAVMFTDNTSKTAGGPFAITLSVPTPNPFNQSAAFAIHLTEGANVDIKVYDILGRNTADIFHGYLNAGTREFNWNTENLASGTYFLTARSNGEQAVKKLILIK